MEQSARSRRAVRFGVFEVDLRLGELRKNALKLKLQDQPFQVLALLLEHPGDLISREELRKKLWPYDTFVDFDHGINIAIHKLREALNDSAEKPRFIETLDRRGYRFIFPIESVEFEDTSPTPAPRLATPAEVSPIPPVSGALLQDSGTAPGVRPPRPIERWWGLRATLAAVIVVLALLAWKYLIPTHPTTNVMMAILPFDNLSGDPGQDYFSDGLTEEMIAQLGRLQPERLGVIAWTSAKTYKSSTKNIRQIGRELGVQYILEGSVRRAGNRVRITAQLIQVRAQTPILTETYERDMSDVLGLQSDVARAIAGEIQLKLTPQQQAHLESTPSVNPAAYDAYVKGRFYWNKRTGDGFKKGMAFFQQAIQQDPNYAPAYAGLADSYALLGSIAIGYEALPPREAMPKAEEAALNALRIDDTLAEAHTSLAYARLSYDWDWAGAEREFKRALALNPGYATGHQWYALYLSAMGRQADAMAEIKRARELDPLSLAIYATAAQLSIFARQYDQAIQQCQKALELDPDSVLAHYNLGRAYEEKGMYAEAITVFRKGKALPGGVPGLTMALGHAYALSGNRGEAQKAMQELIDLSKQRYVPALYVAAIYAALGEKDQGFQWLNKAYNERSDYVVYLRRDPMSDPGRSDPRFQDMMHRIGLPP